MNERKEHLKRKRIEESRSFKCFLAGNLVAMVVLGIRETDIKLLDWRTH